MAWLIIGLLCQPSPQLDNTHPPSLARPGRCELRRASPAQLEQQLQRQLNLARRAGGGRDPARCRTEAAAAVDRLGEDVGARLSEVYVVRQVERLDAELQRRGSLKRNVFQKREVDRRE